MQNTTAVQIPEHPVYLIDGAITMINTDTTGLLSLFDILFRSDAGPNNQQGLWFCGSHLSGDTLSIWFVPSSFNGMFKINWTVVGDDITAWFIQDFGSPSLLRAKIQDDASTSITLPITFEQIRLNTLQFSPGDIIYGYAKMIIPPYFIQIDDNAKKLLHVRRSFEISFKIKIGSQLPESASFLGLYLKYLIESR